MSYSSAVGRFLERDPIGYDDGMNLYQAYRSNPVNRVDSLGTQSMAPTTQPSPATSQGSGPPTAPSPKVPGNGLPAGSQYPWYNPKPNQRVCNQNKDECVIVYYGDAAGKSQFYILEPGKCSREGYDEGDFVYTNGAWYKNPSFGSGIIFVSGTSVNKAGNPKHKRPGWEVGPAPLTEWYPNFTGTQVPPEVAAAYCEYNRKSKGFQAGQRSDCGDDCEKQVRGEAGGYPRKPGL